MAVCGMRCAMARNTQQGTLADRGGASLRGRWVSCRLSQAGSGMARAKARVNWDSQGQRRGIASEAARRGVTVHQSEDPPPEGLGGYGPFAQKSAPSSGRGYAPSPGEGAVGGETPRRHVVQRRRIEVAYGVLVRGGDDRPPEPPHRGR